MPAPDKYEAFQEWFHYHLKEAGIVDVRYPAKGMNVWLPYGLKALRLSQRILMELLERTGHQEAYFPTLIPESVFAKEKEFLEGFSGETFVVEGTPTRKLGERYYVRPTSETVMYYMWSMWINGRRDLPLKMYQVVNVFRYETKMTHPILRVREIMGFIEAHTAHATAEEAEEQVREAVKIYKEFFDRLLLPYFIVKTPPWDTFAGAEYNYDFVTVMPDGKGLELGSVINLGQRFARAFDIKFMDSDGQYKYVYQTCYGVSERVLGAVIGIHGDSKGLVFPPEIAPIQAVIVPIAKETDREVFEYANKIARALEGAGIRVHVDADIERTPGWKYYYWEMKGVPTRLDVGRRELATETVTVARRDTGEKVVVRAPELVEELRRIWADMNRVLRARALEHLRKLTAVVGGDEAPQQAKGLVLAPWDGSRACADELEKTYGKQVLGEVVESPIELSRPRGNCGSPDRYALLGTTY
ncbi:MAG: proline--tRNA ligase [Desulfurococcaceae archaeon]